MASPVDEAALRGLAEDLGGEEAVREVVDAYLADAARMHDVLRSAAATRDERGFTLAVHTLKSSSGLVGARRLSDLCREAETLAKGGRAQEAMALLPDILAELRLVREDLAARRGRMG